MKKPFLSKMSTKEKLGQTEVPGTTKGWLDKGSLGEERTESKHRAPLSVTQERVLDRAQEHSSSPTPSQHNVNMDIHIEA